MTFRLLPREDEYFTLFSQISEKIQEASNGLGEMLSEPTSALDLTASQKMNLSLIEKTISLS